MSNDGIPTGPDDNSPPGWNAGDRNAPRGDLKRGKNEPAAELGGATRSFAALQSGGDTRRG